MNSQKQNSIWIPRRWITNRPCHLQDSQIFLP